MPRRSPPQNRTYSRVRRQRVALKVLFQRLLPEPRMTDFRITRLSSNLYSRMIFSIVSAFRISRTSQAVYRITSSTSPCEQCYCSPWWSVTSTTTIGIPSPWDSRPVGDPVFRHQETSREQRRFPFRLLKCIHYPSLINQRLSSTKLELMTVDDTGVQTCYR